MTVSTDERKSLTQDAAPDETAGVLLLLGLLVLLMVLVLVTA